MALLVEQLNLNLADRRMKVTLAPDVDDWIIDVTCKDRRTVHARSARAIQRYVEDRCRRN
jgi:ATP-dependent Clp protease ATP-binding subunit ClpA